MDKDDKNDLLTELCEALIAQDKAYSLDGPMMLTVKMPDNTFRRKDSLGMDYLPKTFYHGQKEPIFCFVPEDPQEWVSAEIKDEDMDAAFPLFLEDVKEWAQQRFHGGTTNRAQRIEQTVSVSDLMALLFSFAEADSAAENELDQSAMTSLPTFGMF